MKANFLCHDRTGEFAVGTVLAVKTEFAEIVAPDKPAAHYIVRNKYGKDPTQLFICAKALCDFSVLTDKHLADDSPR